MGFTEEVDVVVIGRGAGGAPVAPVLAEAGARVVILERKAKKITDRGGYHMGTYPYAW